jgi:threonine dehydrogenase-like Zn-dependent dehydrogenase
VRAPVARDGHITVEDVPDPEPGEGQLLVASRACGICGSDLHHLSALSGSTPGLIYGHEFCAEVLDYGPKTDRRLKVGTLVCSVPYADGPDGPELIGYSMRFPGGFAPQLVLQEHRLIAVPGGMDAAVAALTEPLGVGLHAVNTAVLDKGKPALVVGCGPVGLAVIVALKAKGHGPVIASDLSARRRRAAERLGADIVVDPGIDPPLEHWSAWGVADGVNSPLLPRGTVAPASVTVFECVGVPGMLSALMAGVPRHSHIVVVGVCLTGDTIYPAVGTAREAKLSFVFGYTPDEFEQSLRLLEAGTVDVDALVTATVDMDGVAAAFQSLSGPDPGVKVLVTPDGS